MRQLCPRISLNQQPSPHIGSKERSNKSFSESLMGTRKSLRKVNRMSDKESLTRLEQLEHALFGGKVEEQFFEEETTTVSGSSLLIPMVALISGWILLGEIIELTSVIGFVLILTGVFLVNMKPRNNA